MRVALVLLFAVCVSSMKKIQKEVESTEQENETNQNYQPMLIAMMDHMKDLLDNIENIIKEMAWQPCQETEKQSLHEDNPAHKSSDCVDKNNNCQFWANGGYCRSDPAYMTPNCPKSCNKCGSDCVDKNKDCQYWANNGYCSSSPAWMTPNCPKSCNTCETKPTTSTSNCDYSTFGSGHTMNLAKKPSCGPNKYSGVSASEINTILNKHNTLRAKVANGLETRGCFGPQPSATNMLEMRWNSKLAEVAQAWAEQCQNFPNPHDSGINRKICDNDYQVGQNIYFAWGFDSASAWEVAIDTLYNEVKDMPNSLVSRFGTNTCSTGGVIGHYTQLVWAATNEVGCGGIHYVSTRGGTTYPDSKIYVCNYGPSGNFWGSSLYESGATASNCPSGRGASVTYPGLCA